MNEDVTERIGVLAGLRSIEILGQLRAIRRARRDKARALDRARNPAQPKKKQHKQERQARRRGRG